MDIGFRKEKGRYSEKARALGPSSPSPGGAGSGLVGNHFVVGQFEFATIAKKSWPKAQA